MAQIPISALMRYFRVPTGELPVDYPGREMLLGSRITNVSTSGVFIRTKKPLTEGARVELSFRLPSAKRDIRATAVVRWVKPGHQGGMGLEFVALERRDERAIEAFVRNFLKRMRRRDG